LRVSAGQVSRLERWIDAANERLEPLRSFILPGGTPAAAHLHHARTVCRRVEIGVLDLAASAPLNSQVAMYLNRLSDLLFVLARVCNDDGQGDVLWQPGRGRGAE
jgi:cob(I)alamin adenosyltransferase